MKNPPRTNKQGAPKKGNRYADDKGKGVSSGRIPTPPVVPVHKSSPAKAKPMSMTYGTDSPKRGGGTKTVKRARKGY